MNISSAQLAHWTDEQLIDHLYGVGPAGGHLEQCPQCRARLSAMSTRREQVAVEEHVSDAFLAAQRRAIYDGLSEPHHWWQEISLGGPMGRRLAAAATMFVVLLGSAAVYQNHRRELAESRADAQLAQDVSQMAFDTEAQVTEPLRALFVE